MFRPQSQDYVRAISPPEKPAWLFGATDSAPSAAGLFRLERFEGAWYLFSNRTQGYMNCIEVEHDSPHPLSAAAAAALSILPVPSLYLLPLAAPRPQPSVTHASALVLHTLLLAFQSLPPLPLPQQLPSFLFS